MYSDNMNHLLSNALYFVQYKTYHYNNNVSISETV